MAVELSQGYVSFSVSTEGAAKQVERFMDSWQSMADTAGRRVGASLQTGVRDALTRAKAEHERYAIEVAASTKKAAAATESHEAALRKVAIAEARLRELKEGGKATESQLLAATDRLATARKNASDAGLRAAAADKAVRDAQDAVRQSSERLAKAQKDVETSSDRAANSATGLSGKLRAALDNIRGAAQKPFAAISDSAERESKKAGDSFDRNIGSGMDRVRTRSLAFASMLGSLGANLISRVADVGTEAVKAGLQTASGMEKANIAFTTMLGSAEKSSRFLKDLSDFAARTPFEFPDLQTAASSLISAGVNAEKVIPIMRTLGDVTSGMGTGAEGVRRATVALQQMQAAGRITGEDLNQLRDAGIPVYDLLAAATGRTKEQVVELAKAGKLGKTELDAMMRALESGEGLERFAGLMDQQSDSLEGLWSTFRDTVNMGIAQALQPLVPLLKDGIGGSATFLSHTALPAFQSALSTVISAGKTIASVFSPEGDAGRAFAAFASTATDVTTPLGSINEAGKRLQESFVTNLLPGLTTLGSSIRDHALPLWQHLGDLFVTHILPVLANLGNFIAGHILPILGSLAAFIGEHVIPVVTTIAKTVIDTVVPAFAAIANVIITNVLPPLASFVNFIIDNVMPKVMQLVNEIVVPLFQLFAQIITWAVNNIVVPALRMLGDFLTGTLGPVFTWLWENAISPAIDNILGGVRWLKDDGVRLFTAFMDNARSVVQNGVDTIATVWDGIKAAFQAPMKFVQDIVNSVIDAFNSVSKIFGGPTVGKVTLITTPAPSRNHNRAYATGGVLPGYSPGRDNMHFFSPQWGSLSLSGGEAIMVPEFAKILGEEGIELLNRAARAGRQALHGAIGGMHFANGGIINFRGHRFTAEFARRLQLAEAMSKSTLVITQGGWRPATSYSGTSHAGDAVDIARPITQGVLIALRSVGIPSWDRTGKGNWIPHIHGVPLPGAGIAGGSAVWQAQDYLRGGDGLGGRDNGPRVGFTVKNVGDVAVDTSSPGLVSWADTFAGALKKVAQISAPGEFGKMLTKVPGKIVDVISDGAGKLLGLPGYARGVDSAPPGWAWVGEQGPELLRFRGGERVLSASESRRMMGGMPDTVVLVDSDGTFIARMRAEADAAFAAQWDAGTATARKEVAAR